jgi:hypothetical protein
MVKIDRIGIGGFRNIEYAEIRLQQMTALLAPNNYGKSNILDAIMFASSFVHGTPDTRRQMMREYTCISINSKIAGKPFCFQIEGSFDSEHDFLYRFGFEWYQQTPNSSTAKEGRITSEYLGIRDNTKEKPKYRTIINRTTDSAKYDATGRCNKAIPIADDELVLVKLSNIDSWSFLPYSKELLTITISSVDIIADPKQHFLPRKMMTADGEQLVYDGFTQYIYQLKQEDERLFNVMVSVLTTLVPTIQSVQPVRYSSESKQINKDVPYELPDLYDVYVKERPNNQTTPFRFMSTGSMRILFLLASVIHASKRGVQILMVEELENSIHPDLLQSLLRAIPMLLGDTKLLFTSHSTHLAKHLTYDQLYVGLPSDEGVADFRIIRQAKLKNVLRIAAAGEMALGEYLFELMLNAQDDRKMIDVFFEEKAKMKGGLDD